MKADVRLLRLPTPRTAVFALLALAGGARAFAQPGLSDPAFAGIPLDRWLSGADQARMRWSVTVSHPRLSAHQRLQSDVEIRLDGAELARRRGEGQLLILLQISDQQGRVYQNHMAIELAKVEEGAAKQDVLSTFSAFLTPGDYRVAAALYDTTTREYCVKQEKLEVAPLRNDPLPDAWRDLPAVEFLPPADQPDCWYLPTIAGRLHLPLKPPNPVEIELVMNLTPSEAPSHVSETQSRNLSVLIPAFKVISELDGSGTRLGAELLDLSRQRVTFRQDDVRVLDWAALKRSLAAGGAGTIDLQSLERRRESANFFVGEIGRLVGTPQDRPLGSAPKPRRVLLILSSPVEFEHGVDLEKIALALPPDYRVYYIRYHSFRPSPLPGPSPGRGPRYGARRDEPLERPRVYVQLDQLESTLKPLAPRLFDVDTPEQFRKALATVLAEISNQ